MSDHIFKFSEHQKPRDDRERPDEDELVKCARCGAMIPGTSTRCPECRVHFQGEAQDFYHESEREERHPWNKSWAVAIVVVLLVLMILGSLVPR
ncbi:hypothetical protein [Singulisphaera sp. PoT]|uniref:hypothetical protein n=1 Tax=Singulisphaera sp. PoT TaxID=3411797 RepID=UPI003BF5710F